MAFQLDRMSKKAKQCVPGLYSSVIQTPAVNATLCKAIAKCKSYRSLRKLQLHVATDAPRAARVLVGHWLLECADLLDGNGKGAGVR